MLYTHYRVVGVVWSEYDEAEDVAWMAPGVTSVTNNIFVTY